MTKGECSSAARNRVKCDFKRFLHFPLLIYATHWGRECMAETPWLWPSWDTWWWDLNECLSNWCRTDLMVPLAFAGLKQALWFGMEASHVTTKPVQWSSDLQPVRALYSGAALKQKLVALSAWVGVLVYQCVQSSMKVIWHDFFIYVSSGWQGLGREVEEEEEKEEAERQEQRSRFGRS